MFTDLVCTEAQSDEARILNASKTTSNLQTKSVQIDLQVKGMLGGFQRHRHNRAARDREKDHTNVYRCAREGQVSRPWAFDGCCHAAHGVSPESKNNLLDKRNKFLDAEVISLRLEVAVVHVPGSPTIIQRREEKIFDWKRLIRLL